jgi:hypothetical protein
MTLHRRKVDDRTLLSDGDQPLDLPAGWQIADGSADDVRVCGAHCWQSLGLIFANGDVYGTAVHNNEARGNAQNLHQKIEIPNPLTKTEIRGESGQRLTFKGREGMENA